MSKRKLPQPTLRNGSLTYELRTRVGGKIRTRSLKTRDFDEALRRLPAVYQQLMHEHDKVAMSPPVVSEQPQPTRRVRPKGTVVVGPVDDLPDLSNLIGSHAIIGVVTLPQTSASNAIAPAAPSAPLLLDVLENYLTERGAGLRKAIVDEHRTTVRDFCDVVGNKPITDFTRDDGRRFKEVLFALPANRLKLPETKHLGAVDAANVATKLGLPRQATKTLQNKRGTLRKIFQYARANYDGVFNPFEDKAAWALSYKPGPNQRDGFRDDELKALFSSRPPGHLYWLSWLGLCTGARLNELCQLTSSLVRTNSLPHIYIAPSMRLKTEDVGSSIRSIPLHQKLLDLGILDYARACSSNEGGQLFPGLPERRGLLSDKPSKDFARHLKALDVKRPKLTFHSLRHTFAAEFKRRAPLDFETRERLMGHVVPGDAGRYGNNYEAEANDMDLLVERAKSVAKLKFDY